MKRALITTVQIPHSRELKRESRLSSDSPDP